MIGVVITVAKDGSVVTNSYGSDAEVASLLLAGVIDLSNTSGIPVMVLLDKFQMAYTVFETISNLKEMFAIEDAFASDELIDGVEHAYLIKAVMEREDD